MGARDMKHNRDDAKHFSAVQRAAGLRRPHFVIAGNEPLLFHCGLRKMFPLVSAAVAKIMPVDRLRWPMPDAMRFSHWSGLLVKMILMRLISLRHG
jgi:hypothetical protein